MYRFLGILLRISLNPVDGGGYTSYFSDRDFCIRLSSIPQSRQRSLDKRNRTHAKKKKAVNTLFPAKLRGLLDDAVAEGNEHMISWLPGGNVFKIHDPDMLAEHLLKRYFRQNSFKSFSRQL